MRVLLVLFAAVAVVLCSEAEETTMPSSSTTTTTSSTTTAEATTIQEEPEEGTKTKRTIGNSLGYGYNDIGDGRAFYSHPAATQQQYQTVRYYHAKAAQDQPQQYHQESPQHSQTVYSKPQQPQQQSIFSNALLSQHNHLLSGAQQHQLLGAGQHNHFLGAAQQSPFLGAAQQNHLLSAAQQNPLLALQHGGSPFLSSGGAPFLYHQPGQHNFLQQSQLFGGPHVIPVIILRVSDPAQHGLVTPAFIQPNFPAHQPLHNMLVQYLQQTVPAQTQTAYYPEHQQVSSQSTKPLYVQQQVLVTPTPEKKQLLSSSVSQKPRKTAVSIEQAQNLDNSFAQYSKYSQYKDKV